MANVPLSEFPEDVDFVFVLTFAATVFGLKYLIYELAVRALACAGAIAAIVLWKDLPPRTGATAAP